MKLIISFIFISFFHTCWANSRVALVFSGGGARGLAHIGVIKVLEENKIPIDFIVGNSMGSIIGGLYAAGYSAKQLEDEVRMIPWTQVFTDKSLRRNVSLRQKSLQDRVALSFPVRNGKVSLPTGLVKGNTLKKHLRRLCWPIRNIKNFNDLEIPFMAISTDILSGRAVQLTSGELAEAMQASMSLPSVFQPQKVDGKLLMDGMMIRNLPVQDAKEAGADVLIAVDVGTKLYKETELNSMVDIIDQSISFMNVQTSAYQESLADVIIRPRVKNYTTGQFSDFDSLIKLGETAAREKLPQIKQVLASKGINASKSINSIDAEEWSKPVRIEQITIEGLDKDLTRYIEKEFGNQYPLTMTQDEIEEIVDRVYGTDVFDWVTYEVHGHHLVLKLSPKETRDLNIGLNYNSDERLSMLINTRLRLVGLKTLKSELDIKLGQWNELESHNIFILNKKITKHTSLHNLIRIREFDISHADNLAPVDFHEYMGELSLQTSANNNRRWLLGLRGRQIHLKDGFPHLNLESQEDLWQLFAGFHYDSLDVSTFPTEGTLLYLDYEYAHEDMNDISDFSRKSFKFARYNKLNASSSIFGVYKESRAEGPVVSLHAKTYLGGQSKFLWDHTSFLGYKRLSSTGNYSQSLLLGYQNEIAPDLYFRALINAGLATDVKSDLYEYSKMKQAAGIELGYKARYGSAKIGVYHNREGTYSLHFDLGHRF